MIYDVCIIGGGASGLAAAISAARQGASVLVIEQMDKTGKKIPATGNGRCNLTNLRIRSGRTDSGAYRGRDPHFAIEVTDQFDSESAVHFFESVGVYTKDRDGYVYPRSDQAQSVLDALRWECADLKADIVTGEKITKAFRKQDHFEVMTSGRCYESRKLILACGGMSQKKLGSDGSGYTLAKNFGHHLVASVPALCALHCKEKFFKDLAGIRINGNIKLIVDQKESACDEGELQLTAYGISGIPVFQVSRFASEALCQKKSVFAVMDFMPSYDLKTFQSFAGLQCREHPDRTLKMILSGFMNRKLAAVVIEQAKVNGEIPVRKLNSEDLRKVCSLVKSFKVQITKAADFDQSQVTAGGVSTKEINSSDLSSKLVRGLYITGEMLDIDGICGGYNLHFAWATGILAGKNAGRKKS